MKFQQKHWTLCQICILFILNLHLTLSTRCEWKHTSAHYGQESCETTTVLCKNITIATLDDFHDEQITEDCYSKRCYGIDIHDSDIYSINKTTLAVKLACKLYEIILTKDHIHTIDNNTFEDCPRVWYINLEDNEISTTNFLRGDLKNLRILNLASNKLERIERTTFNSLEKLENLYLNNNLLNSIEDEAFKSLTNLEYLQLNNNNIQSISEKMFTGLNKLNYLYLQENPIKSITPGAFSSLNNLMIFNLSGSNIETLENNTFIGLEHLESLNLTNLKIKNLKPGAFNSMTQLLTLDLSRNNIESIFEETFFDLNKLKILNLSFNKISFLNLESFTGLINLRKLILNDNVIKEVPPGIFESSPLLENLQLGNNYLSQLKHGNFLNLVELKYLNLSHNVFSELDVTVFVSLRSLRSLKLDNNHLTEINYRILLLHLPKLGFISINNNNWTCNFLADMLKVFKLKNIEYLFNISSQKSEENVEGILCTNRTEKQVPENSSIISINPESNPVLPNEIENILKDVIFSNKNTAEILKSLKEKVDVLSENNNKPKIDNNNNLPPNIQKDLINILNTSSVTNKALNNLEENFNKVSRNINDDFKNFESNLVKISDYLEKNNNNHVTEEKILKLVGNLSKSDNEPKSICTFNYGLYVISVFILIIFTIIAVVLVYKYFQTNRRNSFTKTRSEIELLNATS